MLIIIQIKTNNSNNVFQKLIQIKANKIHTFRTKLENKMLLNL